MASFADHRSKPELTHIQALKAIAGEMRGAILRRDVVEIERLTTAQEATCRTLRGLGPTPDPEVRRLAAEVRAAFLANEALLRESLEVIDRLVRTIARPPDAGTYGAPGAAAMRAPSRAASALLSRTA